MTKKGRITGKFKSKVENVLKDQGPAPENMEDFLKDTQNHKDTIPQLPESVTSQMDHSTNENLLRATNYKMHKSPKEQKHKLCRLHIQIRQDLVDKLLDMVFKRKRNPDVRMRDASQRAIIEEALDHYFISKRM